MNRYLHVDAVRTVRDRLGVVVGGRGAVDVHAARDQPARAEDGDHAVVHLHRSRNVSNDQTWVVNRTSFLVVYIVEAAGQV